MAVDASENAPPWLKSLLERISGGARTSYSDLSQRGALQTVASYRSERESPHWHYLSFGLSTPTESGVRFPFELSFRLREEPGQLEAPQWGAALLEALAQVARRSNTPFEVGHSFNFGRSLPSAALEPWPALAAEAPTSSLRGLVFVEDRLLPPIDVDGQRVTFLQVLGVTADELIAIDDWNAKAFAELLRAGNSLGVTDRTRASVLADVETAKRVRERTEREGSSLGVLKAHGLRWRTLADGAEVELDLPRSAASGVRRMLEGRTRLGREFYLAGDREDVCEELVRVQPSDKSGWAAGERFLLLRLAPEAAERLRVVLDANKDDELQLVRGCTLWLVDD